MRRLPRSEELDAVLLDAGETLIFMQPSFVGAFVVVARQMGHDLAETNIRPGLARVAHLLEERARTRSDLSTHQSNEIAMWREFNRIIFRTAGLDWEAAEEMAVAMQSAFNEGRLNRAAPDTVSATRRLRSAGLKLGVVSNAVAEMDHVLRVCGITDEVDHISISANVGWEKPDPRIFADCTDALGVLPQRVIHVGDSLNADIRGAEAAGLGGSVLMLNGKKPPPGHEGPVIHRLSQLPGLLGIE